MTTNVNIGLMQDTLDCLKSAGKSPGETMNTILSEYETYDDIAAAITRHLQNPIVDPSPIKRTSIYMHPKRITNLRTLLGQTYLPFDAILRIIVQDYLQRHTRP